MSAIIYNLTEARVNRARRQLISARAKETLRPIQPGGKVETTTLEIVTTTDAQGYVSKRFFVNGKASFREWTSKAIADFIFDLGSIADTITRGVKGK